MNWNQKYSNIDNARRKLEEARFYHDESSPRSHRGLADAYAQVAKNVPRKNDKAFYWGKVEEHNNRAKELESKPSNFAFDLPGCSECNRQEWPEYMENDGNGGIRCRRGFGCN
jgi:hypothetical protein